MNIADKYDSSWDTDESGDAFDRKCEEWERRDWAAWLRENLSFPFEVKREEDMDENPFDPSNGPFSVGRRIQAVALDEEDWRYGILIRVMTGKKKGCIPLADVEVTSRANPNYWPVREYVVWAANR
jgi:Calcium binding